MRVSLLIACLFFLSCGKGLGPAAGGDLDPEGDGPGPASDSPVSPSAAPRGTRITIAGNDFAPGTTVTLGGTSCDAVEVLSLTQLTCVVAAHRPGLGDLAIARLSGDTTTFANAFQYKTYLYVANRDGDTISVFTINGTTGRGTEIPGSPFAAGNAPEQLQLDPSRQRLFVLSGAGAKFISVYKIDPPTGGLSEVSASPLGVSVQTYSIFLNPIGTILHLGKTESATPDLESYTVDTLSGALTFLNDAGTGTEGEKISGTKDGLSFFRLRSSTSVSLDGFSSSNELGVADFLPLTGSPYSTFAGANDLVVDPAGKFVFLAEWTIGGVEAFVRGLGGVLESSSLNTVATGTTAFSLAVHPTRPLLFVVFRDGDRGKVFVWNTGSGSLSTLSATEFLTGTSPARLALMESAEFAYVTNEGANTVSYYAVGENSLVDGGTMTVGLAPHDLLLY